MPGNIWSCTTKVKKAGLGHEQTGEGRGNDKKVDEGEAEFEVGVVSAPDI